MKRRAFLEQWLAAHGVNAATGMVAVRRGALALWLGAHQLAGAARIVAVRIWPARDYTRVTIESDAVLKARHQFVADPPRLAVDMEGLDLVPVLKELVARVKPDDPNIAGMRIAQNAPGVVRLVVDLKQPITPQVFQLAPVAAYQHRLVLDLYPNEVPDPLAELIAQRLAESRPAPTAADVPVARTGTTPAADNDPLGALIAIHERRQPATAVAAASTGAATKDGAQDTARNTTRDTTRDATREATRELPADPTGKPPLKMSESIAKNATDTSGEALKSSKLSGPTLSEAPARPSGSGLVRRSEPDPTWPPAASKPSPTAAATDRLIIVALDPGHGGEDPGAIGPGGTQEKDVVLQIAHRLRERINARQIKGNPMRAYMTRDADFFVPLHVRVDKARRVQADLMISIHADAFFTPNPQGASVFALSTKGASSAAARWMAQKENAADVVGGLNVKTSDATVQRALLDMSTTAQINDSLKLGGAMLREIGQVGRLHKPQVEQAGFAVLRAPDIPSVLVETAFISNPDEEARLNDPAYQDRLADALMKGIERYFLANPPLARTRTT